MSAESRLAARLKLVRVRVEFSKNRLKTIRPCRAGTFFRLRVEISANDSAVSRMARISSARKFFQAQQVLAAPARRALTRLEAKMEPSRPVLLSAVATAGSRR